MKKQNENKNYEKINKTKKSPNKTKQNTPTQNIEFVLCWSMAHYCWAWSRPWTMVDIPFKLHWRKLIFPLPVSYQLQITCWLGAGPCPLLPFSAGILACLSLYKPFTGLLCAATISEFMCVSVLLYLKDTVSLESSATSGSYNLSTSSA